MSVMCVYWDKWGGQARLKKEIRFLDIFSFISWLVMGDNEALKLLGIYALHWPLIVMLPIANELKASLYPSSAFLRQSALQSERIILGNCRCRSSVTVTKLVLGNCLHNSLLGIFRWMSIFDRVPEIMDISSAKSGCLWLA